jgi:hypothetical protein
LFVCTGLHQRVAHRFTGHAGSAMRPVIAEIAERLPDGVGTAAEVDLRGTGPGPDLPNSSWKLTANTSS